MIGSWQKPPAFLSRIDHSSVGMVLTYALRVSGGLSAHSSRPMSDLFCAIGRQVAHTLWHDVTMSCDSVGAGRHALQIATKLDRVQPTCP